MKFDWDDILIPADVITDIVHRKDVNIFDNNGYLPLFTAPMDTVINKENLHIFEENKIIPILPRTEKIDNYDNWFSVGLKDFEDIINESPICTMKVLLDVANGHMSQVLDLTKRAKEKFGDNMTLMVGNIANPKTYEVLSNAGADYIRCGVGNGGGCLTTEQSGIGYPMASLISEIYEISCTLLNPAKIVADGGFKKYADIIKALALGADYVMIGSIFNKALESCGDTFREIKVHNSWSEPGELVNQYNIDIKNMFKNGTNFYKKFRGMSTKDVQKSLGNTELKTSEGISKINKVEYTLDGWVDNFSHYLRNNMSYTNCFELNEYIGKVEYVMITPNAFKRFNK